MGTLATSDPDAGDSHTYSLVSGAGDSGNASFAVDGSRLETDAVLDFEATSSFSIRVRTSDGEGGTFARAFAITVSDTAEPPTPGPTPPATTDEDAPVTVTLSASDPEGEDVTSFATNTGPASHGTPGPVGPIGCTGGTPNVCTADVVFTPDADYNGAAGFSYTASDGTHVSLPATVSITVRPINDTPTALDASRTTDEDTPLALDLAALVGDVETADANLTYEIVTPPAHGTATATTYTPAADFNGTDSLTYRVIDRGDPDNCGAPAPACDAPETSTTQTVSITVDPVNDTPSLDASRRPTRTGR